MPSPKFSADNFLSKDILFEILRHLSPSDLVNASEVNTLFNQTVKSLESRKVSHRQIVKVIASPFHTLIFTRHRGKPLLFACGLNWHGQMGLGHNTHQNNLKPVTLPEGMTSKVSTADISNDNMPTHLMTLRRCLPKACR